jgi:hypothetical protein
MTKARERSHSSTQWRKLTAVQVSISLDPFFEQQRYHAYLFFFCTTHAALALRVCQAFSETQLTAAQPLESLPHQGGLIVTEYTSHHSICCDRLVEHGSRATGQPPSALALKIHKRLSVALQRALSHRECAYIDKLRERGTLPPTTCAAEFLLDVQLGGTRLPAQAF